jgi:hypothetical protein
MNQFPLQTRLQLLSLSDVRWLVPLSLGLLLLPAARAQDQERKLVDRLLKPDTTLQNSAQNKKFIADGTSVNKEARVSTFYLQQKKQPKQFAGTRDFSARQFPTRSSAMSTARFSSNKENTNSQRTYSTSAERKVRSAPDPSKMTDTRAFAGSRQFLDRGKSQKSLQRRNPPLTIEQVRELLNKNK